MVTIPQEILEITYDYINRLQKHIKVDKVILFGSYAKGTYTNDSDIDLAIFSDAFANMTRIDGLTFLLMQALEYSIDFQPQPYTLKDYLEKDGFTNEIIETGVEIY